VVRSLVGHDQLDTVAFACRQHGICLAEIDRYRLLTQDGFRATRSRGDPRTANADVFRYARVRQIVRSTRSLALAQRQAWRSRLQMAYLTVGDEEARELMRSVTD